MRKAFPLLLAPALLLGCVDSVDRAAPDREARAERFFRGVYGCDPSVVDELAADSVVLSYPIFQDLYGTAAFRGRNAVRSFAEGFCSRWEDARFTFHEAVAEGDHVVLVWSFRARFVGPASPAGPVPGREQSWGGISLFRFDGSGRIAAEIGEESTPGPMARLRAPADSGRPDAPRPEGYGGEDPVP
jgi:hypothetical protein